MKQLLIDPRKIKNQLRKSGKKIPFHWRLGVKGTKEHFITGKDWTQTYYYQMRMVGRYGDIEGETEIMEYLQSIDAVYDSMKKHGFIEQGAPIGVGIAKDGEVCFYHDGQHRITIAQILGVRQIPVTVLIDLTEKPQK